jgi:hypothetical protein
MGNNQCVQTKGVVGVHRLYSTIEIYFGLHFFICKLTKNTFSFAATTWGIVTGERGMNEPIVNWRFLGDCDG